MCRHLAYVGPPVTLSSPVLDAPHSLLHQSYAPADMRGGGTVNVDGFGVGWYVGVEAVRYRTAIPIWSDTSFASLARTIRSTAVLAAVRSATTGMPVTSTANAPFVDGRWLFSHNGRVAGWPDTVTGLAGDLPVRDLLTLDAPTDSALLWALVRRRLRAGDDPADVLGETVTAVAAAAPGSRLNLLLTDGDTIWATAWDHALSLRIDGNHALVASEPIDDTPHWTEVPDRHLVEARPGHHRLLPLLTTPGVR
ncbi:MAG: ergothioneine biosynthesis protein EgtC [Pseudonocardia sp.]|nr:ergothioneine biosynthesis protein EgtC [Pseudonocardia sp.]